jgi:hypothetical protein
MFIRYCPSTIARPIGTFRDGRWQLDWFLEAIRRRSPGDREPGGLRLPGASLELGRHRPGVPRGRSDIGDLVHKAEDGGAIMRLETLEERARIQAQKQQSVKKGNTELEVCAIETLQGLRRVRSIPAPTPRPLGPVQPITRYDNSTIESALSPRKVVASAVLTS